MTSPTNPIAPPRVLFGVVRSSARPAATAALAFITAHASAQLDLTQTWAARYNGANTASDDRSLGVAVLEDGMVVAAGQLDGSVGPLKGFVSFRRGSDGTPEWLETFADAPGGQTGAAVANAVTAGLSLASYDPPDPPDAPVFSAGWFQRDVNFGSFGTSMTATGSSKDAFVSRATKSSFGGTSWQTNWVFRCGGTGAAESLCVASGPKGGMVGGLFSIMSPEQPPPIRSVMPTMPLQLDFVAAGGFFTGQAIIGNNGKTVNTAGSDDALVVVLKADTAWTSAAGGKADGPLNGMDIYGALTLGSTGADRVCGIAVDPCDQSVVITGQFAGTVQFDPQGGQATSATSQGGTDIFIARYRMVDEDQTPYYTCKLKLDWLYVTGTSGNDCGTSVAIDGFGHVYACGWKNGAGNKRDIWVAKIAENPEDPYGAITPNPVSSAKWAYTYADPPGDVGDDAALSLALDGLDRVLVCGQFGKERTPGGNAQSHTLDFNPLAGTDNRTTIGGLDMFVTRFTPTGGYEWTFTLGGTSGTGGYNDVAAAIAVDPVETTRIAHAGWFGHPDGGINNTYSLDFDPGNGMNFLATSGIADGYVSSLLPTMPESIKTQTIILLDNSGSVTFDEYAAYMPKLQTVLISTTVIPQDGTAALNAVMFGVDYPGWSLDTERRKQVMPWTAFTPQTAALFARKLASIPQPVGGDTNLAEGLKTARRTLVNDRLTSCYRTIAVVADGCNREDPNDFGGFMLAARNDVVDGDNDPDVDQVNGLAARGDPTFPQADRAYLRNFVVKAEKTVPTIDNWLGFAFETTLSGYADTNFAPLFSYMIRRSSRCPGDYDGNGAVEDVVDRAAFIAASVADDPYSDWNGDGLTDGDNPNGLDRALFEAALSLGCCP